MQTEKNTRYDKEQQYSCLSFCWYGLYMVHLVTYTNWTPVKSIEPKTQTPKHWTHDERQASCFNLITTWSIQRGSTSMFLTWISRGKKKKEKKKWYSEIRIFGIVCSIHFTGLTIKQQIAHIFIYSFHWYNTEYFLFSKDILNRNS